MKVAYFDCFSGVAGDMLLAALLDAGAPLEELLAGLRTISPIKDEWDVELQHVTKGMGSIAAAHVKVASKYGHRPAPAPKASIDPGSEHEHAHSHSHSHSHSHGHSHSHSHDHGSIQAPSGSHDGSPSDGHGTSHSHEDTTGGGHTLDSATSPATHAADVGDAFQHGPVRNLGVISKMLAESGLPAEVKERSIAVFTALGEAEAKTHGSTLDQVHFHEVGAIDSIIDTVGVVYALHLLGVEKVFCSALPFSEGTVWTAHGILPVPAPATLRLMVGVPTCPGPKSARGELVTPTGAALVRVLSSEFGRPPLFVPQAIGIGAGTKDFEKHPNILRVIVGDVSAPAKVQEPLEVEELFLRAPAIDGAEGGDWSTRQLWVLEANIDDMTGEAAGYLTEKVRKEGSLDAWITPIVMKKSRPAFTVHVLCELQDQARFMRLLFVESTTLGVRKRAVERCALRRKTVTAPTSFGDVRVKVAWLDGVAVSTKPEYEDCKVLAASARSPLQAVTDQARAAAKSIVANFTEEQKK